MSKKTYTVKSVFKVPHSITQSVVAENEREARQIAQKTCLSGVFPAIRHWDNRSEPVVVEIFEVQPEATEIEAA